MRHRSRSGERAALVALLTLGTAFAAGTGPVVAEPALYGVRAGSQLVTCGGFAGGCDSRELLGTIELDVTSTDVTILDTNLFVTTGTGGPFAFPAPGDLQLAGLEGTFVGPEAKLEADDELGQSARLVLVQIARDLSAPEGGSFALQGVYDEGCCDRFVYELGNVVLDRVPDEDGVLLDGDVFDRFTVRVQWKETEDGASMDAVPVRTGPNAAQFWFFSPDNPEIFVKIVPACEEQFEHQVWVFVAGLTDLGVSVVVGDSLTEIARIYESTPGEPFVTVTDTRAFACEERLE